MSVVALLHEGRSQVERHYVTDMLRSAVDRLGEMLGRAGRAIGEAARQVAARLGRLVREGPQPSPLDPLIEGGPPLPGTSDRAFWSGLVIVSLAVVSGLATYLILTGLTPIVPRNDVVLNALIINALLVVAMVALIALQLIGLWRAWREKVAGARLHARIVALFSLIAALPALLLAVAATTTFSRALDSWFNQQTQAIVQNSLVVGSAYLLEHGQVIRTDIVNMARDLDDAAGIVAGDKTKFRELMIGQASLRDLPAAYVIDGKGDREGCRAGGRAESPTWPRPRSIIRSAETGHVPLLMPLQAAGAGQREHTLRSAAASTWSATPSAAASPPSPSCATIPTPTSTWRAASTRRWCGTCAKPTRASPPTRSCGARAAACSSHTACCTS